MSDPGNDNIIDLRESPEDHVVLSVRDLTKHFPVRQGLLQRVATNAVALDRVSFDVLRGSTVAVVGESGGGKTTLGRCLAGLEKPTAGGVYLRSLRGTPGATDDRDGEIPVHELDREATRRFHRRCQLVTQHSATSLNPKRNVCELIGRALEVYGTRSDRSVEDQVVSALKRVGLGDQDLFRFPSEFSTGQLQRIAIAQALALHPEVLVLDEPTASVDLSAQAHVLNLLVELQRREKLSYVLITHDLSVALHMADDAVVLRSGQVVESGPIEAVLQHPKHPYTQQLVDADPDFTPRR